MTTCRLCHRLLATPLRAVLPLAALLGAWLAPAPLAAQPQVGIFYVGDDGLLHPGLPPSVLIGEDFHFVVKVSPGPTTGFAPFVELYLDLQGADCNAPPSGPLPCDGISFVAADAQFTTTHLPLTPCPPLAAPFAFNVSGTACTGGPVCPGTSPVAPTSCFFGAAPPTCESVAGYQKVVLPLPFGSFVPAQPPVLVDVTVAVASFANPGSSLTVKARGGFQYSTATGGPPIVGPVCPMTMASAATTPSVIRLHKKYTGPEDETATGPNFPVTYQISVDVARGQTVNSLEVSDCLSTSLVFQSSAPLAFFTPPCANWNLGTVTGGATHPDQTLTLTGYVPLDDSATGQPVLGASCKTVIDNPVTATAQWNPLDPREMGPETVNASADQKITAKCIALQKTAQEDIDTGAHGPTPGDTILYTLKFEISDFDTFDSIVLDDYLADGLVLVGTPAVTLFDKFPGGASSFITPTQSVDPGVFICNDGTRLIKPTHLRFDLSSALATLSPTGRHFHGILTGGQAGLPLGGGPAEGFIFFRAKIADTYLRQPVTPANVKKDDTLLNCPVISGTLLQNTDAPALPPPTPIGAGDDDSLAAITIVTGILSKTVFAVNGTTPSSFPPLVSPGDFVTFRLQLPVPSSDAADLFFDDYLPSPVFSLTGPLFAPTLCSFASSVFSAGGTVTPLSIALCPVALPTPTLTPIPGSNSLHIAYGTLDDRFNTPRSVDLLVTLKATAAPFVDGLHFTNHVLESEQNSFGVAFDQTEVAQMLLGEPELRIRKGVVGVIDPSGAIDPSVVFTPAPPAPAGVTFLPPGSPAILPFSGTINSTNVGTALNSDASGVDGCDRLRFVIAIENIGHSAKGAFNVRLKDLLPACLQNPANLRVTRGDGTPLSCLPFSPCPIGGPFGLFGPAGITLKDSLPNGALAPDDPLSGKNIAIITFDATVPCGIAATGCCSNTARLLEYTGTPASSPALNHVLANFSTPFPDTTNPFVDGAQICIEPQLSKSIAAISEIGIPVPQGLPLTIGEVVKYRLQLALPVGVSPGLTLHDTLPPGLGWMPGSCALAFKDPNLISGPPSFVFTPFTPSLTVNFGTVTNPPTGPNGALLAVTCDALVLNSPPGPPPTNHLGDLRPNSFTATLSPSTGPPVTFTSNAVPAVIVEPAGGLVKQELPPLPGASPNAAFYQLSYTNTGTANAYDLTLRDPLPAPLTLVSGSVSVISASPCVLHPGPLAFNKIVVTCPVIGPGSTVSVQFSVIGVALCQPVTNLATLTYSSLPGPNGTIPNPTGAFPPGNSGAPRGERVYSSNASAVSRHCPDLAIQKSHDVFNLSPFTSPAVPLGGNFTLTVTNVGNTPSVPPATVTDVLPKGLLCSKAGGSGWTCNCSSSSQTVTCTRTTPILPNESSSITIAVVLSGSDPGPYTNCASVATTADINPANNASCVEVPFCIGFPDASLAIPNMISWWPFDEPAGAFTFDFVNGAGGRFVPPSGPNIPQRTPGMVAGSLCFNGSGSFVDVQPGPGDLGTGDLTIDTWVKTKANSGIQPILDKRQVGSSGLRGYSLFLFDGSVAFQMADGPGSFDCSTDPSSACTNFSAPPGTGVADGQWHHVAVTVVRNQKDGGTLYVDCSRVGTFDPTVRQGNLNNGADLLLAAEYDIGGGSAPAETLSGCLDELEIFNRALSLSEIQAFCTAGAYGKCKFKAH